MFSLDELNLLGNMFKKPSEPAVAMVYAVSVNMNFGVQPVR